MIELLAYGTKTIVITDKLTEIHLIRSRYK